MNVCKETTSWHMVVLWPFCWGFWAVPSFPEGKPKCPGHSLLRQMPEWGLIPSPSLSDSISHFPLMDWSPHLAPHHSESP